ncbi:MAG: NAD-binding protein, partial [Alphaproteobacteria bacterium]|nr:NAD-binding protein [Alphaproteobacteria bacterium]
LFFMSVGMDVDLAVLLTYPVLIPAALLGLFALKAAVIYPLARFFGMARGRAIELGLLLGQAGEFALVVINMATANRMIAPDAAQFMLILTSLSMMVTPLVANFAYGIRQALDGADLSPYGPAAHQIDSIDGHVILAGYGRMGSLLRDVLARQYIPVVAIDTKYDYTHDSKTPVLLGDATEAATMERAGLRRAIAVAVIMDKAEDAKKVVSLVRRMAPGLPIVARARDNDHAAALYRLGATVTIPDVVEGSLHVAQELMMRLGIPEDLARHTVDQQRAVEGHIIESMRPRDAQRPDINAD